MTPSTRFDEYTVWLAETAGGCRPVGEFLLETDHRGRHYRSGFRYREDWLGDAGAFPLNPVPLPLGTGPIEWRTREYPAILDEVLPGQWERMLLRHWWNREGLRRDPDDLHAVLAASRSVFRPGAVAILPAGMSPPPLEAPLKEADLLDLMQDARRVESRGLPEAEVLQRLRGGSSAGGARPKALVTGDGEQWLAKFNRDNDPFDHVRVESFCLSLADAAGLRVPRHRVVQVGELKALLVERFDTTAEGGRTHMLSANALLKDAETQQDSQHPRYDDLADVIRHYGAHPARDLQRLYAQMLFNEAINNRDDHLRNFSFLQSLDGVILSPAYDLVPTEALGAWPVLSFGLEPGLPRPGTKAALSAAKAFGMPAGEARETNDRLAQAFARTHKLMDQCELATKDQELLTRLLWTP